MGENSLNNHILDYWEDQANRHGTSHNASWGDLHAVRLEIENIGKRIKAGDHVLDVGCANGYSAFHHLGRGLGSITGVDFSTNMITQAQQAQKQVTADCEIIFEVGDVRDLSANNDSFDVVYTTRVLINLPTWKEQIQGIEECIRVCKPGGTVILSEAFWEPLTLLNALRALKSMPPLVEHDFNRYLKKVLVDEYLLKQDIEFEVVDFSSIYYLGSRFLRELVTDAESFPGFSNPINEIFYDIEKEFSGGGFGIQQAYTIRV